MRSWKFTRFRTDACYSLRTTQTLVGLRSPQLLLSGYSSAAVDALKYSVPYDRDSPTRSLILRRCMAKSTSKGDASWLSLLRWSRRRRARALIQSLAFLQDLGVQNSHGCGRTFHSVAKNRAHQSLNWRTQSALKSPRFRAEEVSVLSFSEFSFSEFHSCL